MVEALRGLSDWGAVVEDHLPAIVAVDPEGASKRMGAGLEGDGAGGAVGKQSDVFGQLLAERIAEEDGARRLRCEFVDDLLPGVDTAGAAEFAEVFGEKRCECGGVATHGGLQELLFKMEEMGGEFLRAIDHGFGG